MVLDQSFFAKSQELINVGGCGFRAPAVWFIDGFNNTNTFVLHTWMKTDVISRLLKQHFKYFPEHCSIVDGVTTPISMQKLVTKIPKLELANALTYSLARIAIDELFSHPVRYRQLFYRSNNIPNFITSILFKPNRYCIAALANALNLNMEIQLVAEEKEVPSRLFYGVVLNNQIKNPKVILQQEGEANFVLIAPLRSWHSTLTQNAFTVSTKLIEAISSPRSLAEVEKLIAEDAKHLIKQYDYYYNLLNAKIRSKELTLIDLKAMYCKLNIQHTDDRHYFKQVFHSQPDYLKNTPREGGYEEEMTSKMLYAVSRGMVLGEINPTLLEEYQFNRVHR